MFYSFWHILNHFPPIDACWRIWSRRLLKRLWQKNKKQQQFFSNYTSISREFSVSWVDVSKVVCCRFVERRKGVNTLFSALISDQYRARWIFANPRLVTQKGWRHALRLPQSPGVLQIMYSYISLLTLSFIRQLCSRRLWTYFVKTWKISIVEWNKSGKHCGKRRNCTFCAISSFVTMFSKAVCCRGVRKGKG